MCFWSVADLARAIKSRKVTSLQLTKMYLRRLKKYDPLLKCVITLTEDLALAQAARADREIASGKYRGPLHGIPWGAKDLLAVTGYKTTWGAMPYKDQTIDLDATVVKRLEQAGAVLVAKLTLGALAMGDVWYGGTTRNPWNPEKGSSGSSAGPAAATAAGLVAFSIGTETLGSIVSPSTVCGVTGLRPTFGRVSRHGAMALSWSMDKIGPMCRTAEDCALVFEAIHGPDGKDLSIKHAPPFNWNPGQSIKELKTGYLKTDFQKDRNNKKWKANDQATLDKLRDLGTNLIPIELPDYPVEAMRLILDVEAAAAFDELTRSGKDQLLVRQTKYAWPNLFRKARTVPAVEYIQANRIRTLRIKAMGELMSKVDLYVAPSWLGRNLTLTNLTGHPTVVMPNGFDDNDMPTSITLTARLFDETSIITTAKTYQDATDWHKKHPQL
jgi:Asp-tRNA(Asn)/Glu-tRNA(Gln) amidotransferase A subunit family amidase